MAKPCDAPWTACFTTFDGNTVGFHISGRPYGSTRAIARCDQPLSGGEWSPEDLEANGNLLAAAPDLYEATKDLIRICEAVRYTAGLGKHQMERVEKAKAAIKKAEGE